MGRPATEEGVNPTIYDSRSPVSVDGYKIGEPKLLFCPIEGCSAWTRITEEPSTGWEELEHDEGCPHDD